MEMRTTMQVGLLFLFGILAGPVSAQTGPRSINLVSGDDPGYRLYLTQIAAAEAFLQLNKVSTAGRYLDACEERYRDKEWQFLKAALDQSAGRLSKPEGLTWNAIRVSPDGSLIAACSSDSLVTLFSLPGMTFIRELRGHGGSVSTLDFSRDGRFLVSGGRDHAVMVWEIPSGRLIVRNDRSFSQGIYQVRFSPDGKTIGVVSWERLKDRPPHIFGFVKLLDSSDGAEIARYELDNHPASAVLFTPGGKDLLLASWGEILYSLNPESGKTNWTYDLSDPTGYNAFHSADLHPGGSQFVAGSTDHRVYLLNVKDGKVLHVIEPWEGHTKTVKAVSFSPNGRLLATAGEDQSIKIWDTAGYRLVHFLKGHTGTVTGIAWDPSGNMLYSSSNDGTLRLWNLEAPFERTYEICDFGPWQTPFAQGNRVFAAPCSDSRLAVYEAATGAMTANLGPEKGLSAVFSGNGNLLFTAGFDGKVRVWDMAGKVQSNIFEGHTARVDGIAWVEKEGKLVSAGDTTLRIWDIQGNADPVVIPLESPPFRVVVHPETGMVFVGFNDGTIRVYEAGTWTGKGSFTCSKGIQEMAISPDGQRLAVFCGKKIEIINTESLERTGILEGHEAAGYGIGFSPDGRYLVSGSGDQTVKFWNLNRMNCTLTIHGYEDQIYNCRFVDGNTLFLSSPQGKIWYYRF